MKHLSSVLILFFFCFSFPLLGQSSLSDGLIAHYPFDEDVQDISGNGYHGKLKNGTSFGADRLDNPNGALLLDGVDDFISIKADSRFKANLPLSITSWVYLEGPAYHIVFNNDAGEDIYEGVYIGLDPEGQIGVSICDGGLPGPRARRTLLSHTHLQLKRWYHLAVIVEGPQNMTLYVDGRKDNASYVGTGSTLMYSQHNPANIGRADGMMGPASWNYFWGKLDELRYYDRVLTATEVVKICELDQPDFTPTTAWIAYPNPFENGFWIEVEGTDPFEMEIYGLRGRLCYKGSQTDNPSLFVSTQSWAEGTYLAKLTYHNLISWKRIVKPH